MGRGHTEPAVLLESKDELSEATSGLADEVWPLIEEANSKAQAHGRISRSKIGIVGPGTLVRAPKGTVVRKSATSHFESLIAGLYHL